MQGSCPLFGFGLHIFCLLLASSPSSRTINISKWKMWCDQFSSHTHKAIGYYCRLYTGAKEWHLVSEKDSNPMRHIELVRVFGASCWKHWGVCKWWQKKVNSMKNYSRPMLQLKSKLMLFMFWLKPASGWISQWDTLNANWKTTGDKIKQTLTNHENKCERCTILKCTFGFVPQPRAMRWTLS